MKATIYWPRTISESPIAQFVFLNAMFRADARALIQTRICKMKKSVNSQTVRIVLPSIRPSAPPISHNRANQVYAASVSICVCFNSEKNT